MSYKIAVASSGGKNIDVSFGAAASFDIYEVDESGYHLAENREFDASAGGEPLAEKDGKTGDACGSSGKGSGCACGCGSGGGCGGSDGLHPKVALLSDCRCVVCQKIGFPIQKQLEKRAIIGFDVDCSVDEALEKITGYLAHIDHHRSLRGTANGAQT